MCVALQSPVSCTISGTMALALSILAVLLEDKCHMFKGD